MKIYELLTKLNNNFPFDLAEKWDNIGLLVGSKSCEITSVLVCLDINIDVIDYAINNKCNTIISHHPIIFNPISKINTDDFLGNLLKLIIVNNINIISMHTNVDNNNAIMSKWIADELGYKTIEVVENDCMIKVEIMDVLANVIENIKLKFNYNHLNFNGRLEGYIKYAYIIGGSGKFMMEKFLESDIDLFMTGDFSYHNFVDCNNYGKAIVDIMHFSEKVFVKNILKNIDINFIEYNNINCVNQV